MINVRNCIVSFTTLYLLLACTIPALTQSSVEKPYSFSNKLKPIEKIPVITLPEFNLQEIREEDQIMEDAGLKVLRFAKTFEVNIDVKNEALSEKLSNGNQVFRLAIESKHAYSINIIFSEDFYADTNTHIYAYNSDKSHVRTLNCANVSTGGNRFHIPPIKGDRLIVEIVEVGGVSNSSDYEISTVNHDYRDFFSFLKDGYFGNSGSCNIDINCTAGNTWQNEKYSVCRTVIYGSHLCSGALINNTSCDGTPYFLTANHCYTWTNDYPNISYEDAVSNTDFYLNYESPSCNGGDGSTAPMVSGAALKANYSGSDFCLIELNSEPTSDFQYTPYYSGWYNQNVSASSATGIHHPRGDVKKICHEYNSVASTEYLSTSIQTSANHWRVIDWDVGVTEGGSSGSPLYNQNHRIIGQLHGGYAACSGNDDNDESDWYGKLFSSWSGGGTNSTRLQNWLDPNNNLTELPGLRYVKDAQLISSTPVSGDIVKFEDVEINTGEDILVEFEEYFETSGPLLFDTGRSIEIKPE